MKTLISAENTWGVIRDFGSGCCISNLFGAKIPWASKIHRMRAGTYWMSYLSNLRIIPTEAAAYDFVWDYVVPLAIPMLLLQANVKKIFKGLWTSDHYISDQRNRNSSRRISCILCVKELYS